MRHMNPTYALLGGLISALAIAAPALAAEDAIHPKLQNRFYLDAGGYWPSVNTSLRVDGPLGVNAAIDLENDLAFEDRPALPFALLNVRLGDRWRIEAEGFKIGRSKTRILDEGIEIRDQVFLQGTPVSSHFDTTVFRLGVGYSFLKTPNSELGAVLGVHATEFDFGITEIGSLNPDRTQVTDALAPLPTLGLYGAYAFSPKWLMLGRADFLSLEYDQYSGSILNLNLGIEYQALKWLGLGLGYRHVDLDVKAEANGPLDGDWVGEFNYKYSGPTLYMSLTF